MLSCKKSDMKNIKDRYFLIMIFFPFYTFVLVFRILSAWVANWHVFCVKKIVCPCC